MCCIGVALLENSAKDADVHTQKRMREMVDLIELSSSWFDDVQRLSPETLACLMKMGSKVQKLLDMRDRFRFKNDATPAAPAGDVNPQELD